MKFKKGSFRLLHRGVWEMFVKGKVSAAEALVYLYLDGGPHAHYTGLYNVSMADISRHTRLAPNDANTSIASLSRRGLVVYDAERQLVFVRGMLSRQNPSFASTEKNIRGVVGHVERMPEESPAVRAFVNAQREIPEVFELLDGLYEDSEGMFEGVSGGVSQPPSEPTGYKIQETEDLRLETGNKKRETGISPNDRETPLASSNRSPNPHSNVKGKNQVKSGSLFSSLKNPSPPNEEKGNGQTNPAAKGSIPMPSAALEILLTVRERNLHQQLEDACRAVLSGEYDIDEFEDCMLASDSLPTAQSRQLASVLRQAITKMSLAGNSRDGQSGDTSFLDSMTPSLRAFAEKVVEEAATGRVSRPKAREELLRGGFSETAAELLVPRKTSR